MTPKLFFENSDYNYLKIFQKAEMVKFAEMYHESETPVVIEKFIDWIKSQPKETFKTSTKTLIKIFFKI